MTLIGNEHTCVVGPPFSFLAEKTMEDSAPISIMAADVKEEEEADLARLLLLLLPTDKGTD